MGIRRLAQIDPAKAEAILAGSEAKALLDDADMDEARGIIAEGYLSVGDASGPGALRHRPRRQPPLGGMGRRSRGLALEAVWRRPAAFRGGRQGTHLGPDAGLGGGVLGRPHGAPQSAPRAC